MVKKEPKNSGSGLPPLHGQWPKGFFYGRLSHNIPTDSSPSQSFGCLVTRNLWEQKINKTGTPPSCIYEFLIQIFTVNFATKSKCHVSLRRKKRTNKSRAGHSKFVSGLNKLDISLSPSFAKKNQKCGFGVYFFFWVKPPQYFVYFWSFRDFFVLYINRYYGQ